MGHPATQELAGERRALLDSSPHFELVELLGEGSGGTVFKVRDVEREELVALKLLHGKGEYAQELLNREFESVRGIEHPNLVQLGDPGRLGDYPYYTMELVEGTSLLRYVRQPSAAGAGLVYPFDETRLRSALSQLICGLTALHSAFRVHRDVKPSNITVTHEGRAVLLDMGIVAGLGDLENPELGVGTPQYMSPEQAAGEPVGPPADLYAVGAILYEALTGQLPHPESGQGNVLVKLQRDPVPPRTLRRDLPQDLSDLCVGLLARDPDARPVAMSVLRKLGAPANDVTSTGATHLRAPELLLGREREQSKLLGHFHASRDAGEWTHVIGSPGRGSSALLRHVLRDIQQGWPQALVAAAGCTRTPKQPYEGVHELMDPIAQAVDALGQQRLSCVNRHDGRWLRALFSSFNACDALLGDPTNALVPDHRERRRRGIDLLRGLLGQIARQRPLVLCVEDVHLAGPETLFVLEALVRPPRPLGLWVVTTSTAPPDGRFDTRDLRTLRLQPLQPESATALARALMERAGFDPGTHPMDLRAGTEPWQALELARGSLEGVKECSAEASLRARIAALPGDCTSILATLTVAGRPVPYEQCRYVTGLPSAAFAEALAQISRSALVKRDRQPVVRLSLEHSRVAECVLGRLTPQQLVDLHERWTLAIRASRQPDPYVRFVHARAAGHNEEAAEQARLAAEEADQVFAFERAADLHGEADRLQPGKASNRGDKYAGALARALELSGRCELAADAYERAARASSGATQLRALSRAAVMRYSSGDLEAGTASIRRALESVDLTLPETMGQTLRSIAWHRVKASVRGSRYTRRSEHQIAPHALAQIDTLWAMGNIFGQGDMLRSFELWSRAHQHALAAGEPTRVGRAILREVLNDAALEKPPHLRSRKRLEVAGQLLEGLEDPYLAGYVQLASGFVEFFSFEPAGALDHFERAETLFRDHCPDCSWELLNIHLMVLQCLLLLGQLQRLSVASRSYSQEARQRGDRMGLASLVTQGSAYVYMLEDDPDGGLAAIDETMAVVPPNPEHLQHVHAFNSRTILMQYRGDPDIAEHVRRWMEPLQKSNLHRVRVLRMVLTMQQIQGLSAGAARSQGEERRRAMDEAERGARWLMKQRNPMMSAVAQLVMARCTALRGDRDATLALLTAGRDQLRALGSVTFGHDYAIARFEADDERIMEIEGHLVSQGVRNIPRYLAQTSAGAFEPLL